VGQEQRAPEGVDRAPADAAPDDPPALEYRLGDPAATRRARAAAALGGATSIAPVVLAVVLLRRLGWGPSVAFWTVAVALAALVAVRAVVSYGAMRRRLRALVITVSPEEIRAAAARDASVIARAGVARIVEVEGSLGGLRVESLRDPASGDVSVVHVHRGGARFPEVRATLERWRAIERRGRRRPAVRFAIGAAIVVAIFFTPFLLEDFVARSKLIAAVLVIGMWIAMRGALRTR
jgi:hypothetical protein